MEKRNLFLIIWMAIVIVIAIIIGIILFGGDTIEEEQDIYSEVTTEETTEMGTLELVPEELPPDYVEYVFTSEEQEIIDETFNPIIDNQNYQTTVSENDILVDITFKDYGTVTFKMYQETAPTTVDWFLSLKDVPTESSETSKDALKFQFITTDREYNTDEQEADVFPIKYSLYQIMNSCNNFYICMGDYTESETDNYNLEEKYLNFFKQYDGDFTMFKECVVLGYAINGHDILDSLPVNFEIESITIQNHAISSPTDATGDTNIEDITEDTSENNEETIETETITETEETTEIETTSESE